MFVTSFWFSCKIRDYSSYELNYTEVLHSSVYGLYCGKTKLFLISWADFKATWRVVVDKLWITPVYVSHKATSTRTCKNNIQGWEILPSSDKEITPLKSSLTLGYNLRKRRYRRRSTPPNRYVCCVTSQYLFRIHFFASKRLSECPAYLYNYIYLLLSPFSFQMQFVRTSLSVSKYDQVLRDKKKEPAIFWSAKTTTFIVDYSLKKAFIVITMIKTINNIKREILNIIHGP